VTPIFLFILFLVFKIFFNKTKLTLYINLVILHTFEPFMNSLVPIVSASCAEWLIFM